MKVMNMLFKYREAFSLRDEIGICPNIEVEIDITDKSPFFIRPYHVREEDKAIIDKEIFVEYFHMLAVLPTYIKECLLD